MRLQTIEKLCCPFDRTDLELTVTSRDIEDRVIAGFLICSTCARLYPIVKGVPIMNPDEYREFSLEQPLVRQWEAWLNGRSFTNFRLTSEITPETPGLSK